MNSKTNYQFNKFNPFTSTAELHHLPNCTITIDFLHLAAAAAVDASATAKPHSKIGSWSWPWSTCKKKMPIIDARFLVRLLACFWFWNGSKEKQTEKKTYTKSLAQAYIWLGEYEDGATCLHSLTPNLSLFFLDIARDWIWNQNLPYNCRTIATWTNSKGRYSHYRNWFFSIFKMYSIRPF